MGSNDTTRTTLARHGLAPSKSRGQNFLVNQIMAERIVAAAGFSTNDQVVEVGVGLGALTIPLAASVARVYGIEVDSGIIRYHRRKGSLPGNVDVHHGDILQSDFASIADQFSRPLKIIANLPYSISNPFLFKIIDNRALIDQVVVMLQKEVADRLTASPGTKAYGIPTVLLSSCAAITTVMRVDAAEFYPRPKIDSRVVRIVFQHNQPQECSFSALQKVVRSSFQNRRKTLLNNLVSAPWLTHDLTPSTAALKQEMSAAVQKVGLDPGMRAETITVPEFLRLAALFEKQGVL